MHALDDCVDDGGEDEEGGDVADEVESPVAGADVLYKEEGEQGRLIERDRRKDGEEARQGKGR